MIDLSEETPSVLGGSGVVTVSEKAGGEKRHEGDPPAAVPNGGKNAIGWLHAGLVGFGVSAYFVILTVWLPSRLLRLGAVASSQQWIQDVTVVGAWGVPLVAGMLGLRRAQEKGLI